MGRTGAWRVWLGAVLLAAGSLWAGPEHRVERLSSHAYVIFGPGGNIGLFLAPEQAILVDSQLADGTADLLKTVRSVTPKPIRYLVNTHVHPDHVGGNAALEPQVQAIVAHANVRTRMAQAQARLEPARRGGLPGIVFGEEEGRARMDLLLGDEEFHLLHLGPAHTDGDLIFGFPAEHVLQMGDMFFKGSLPFIDVAQGGDFDGLTAQITAICGWLPEDAKVIPGHGPVAGKADLERYRDFLKAVQAHARAHPDQDPAALAGSFPRAAWPDFKPIEGFVSWDSLFGAVTGTGPGRESKP